MPVPVNCSGRISSAHAGDLLAEPTFARLVEGTAEEIAMSVHAHPTLTEVLAEAALAVDRGPPCLTDDRDRSRSHPPAWVRTGGQRPGRGDPGRDKAQAAWPVARPMRRPRLL